MEGHTVLLYVQLRCAQQHSCYDKIFRADTHTLYAIWVISEGYYVILMQISADLCLLYTGTSPQVTQQLQSNKQLQQKLLTSGKMNLDFL